MRYFLHITTEKQANKIEVSREVYDLFSRIPMPEGMFQTEMSFRGIDKRFYHLNTVYIVSIVAEAVSE
jgi:hypothetical protein